MKEHEVNQRETFRKNLGKNVGNMREMYGTKMEQMRGKTIVHVGKRIESNTFVSCCLMVL